MALVGVNFSDHPGREVDDLLKLLGLEFFAGFDTAEEVCKP